ncbi:MAG: FtsX-like permease family protein [Clostridium sp.]|nr:MAG: FtsX-like permease family protein [Clostridium sp.]
MKSFNSMTDMMNLSITVLTIASVVLGVVVLYNLGMMSYIERFKEMATLKVLGFNDRKIARLLISQNMWLTIIGIIIGLPLGLLTINGVVKIISL